MYLGNGPREITVESISIYDKRFDAILKMHKAQQIHAKRSAKFKRKVIK